MGNGTIEQFLAEVGRRNGFRGMDPETLRRFAEYFVHEAVEEGPLPERLLHDVLVLGTANAVVTTKHDDGGPTWTQVVVLRGGAALSAKPLRERVFPGSVEPLAETIEVIRAGSIWRMHDDALQRLNHDEPLGRRGGVVRKVLDPMQWAPASMSEWLRCFVLLEWINRSADLQLLTPPQRLALARTAEVVHTSTLSGDALTTAGKRADHLMLLGPGATATVRNEGLDVVVLTGALFGWSAFTGDRAPTDAEVRRPGYLLRWSLPRPLARALSLGPLAHPWMNRFCQERYRVFSYAPSLMRGLKRTSLLRDIEAHRLAPLLQGASAVTWRVGAPPPVPVGLQSGLCVITEGEVVTYQMLPDSHNGSVTMVRVQPVAAHRGSLPQDPPHLHNLDTIGEFEVAERLGDLASPTVGSDPHILGEHLSQLASNRWTARAPSRGVFIPTWRLHRVIGDDLAGGAARVRARATLEGQVRSLMEQLDASQGSFRDDLNLVWVTRGDGSPPDGGDVALLEEVHALIGAPRERGGFEERSLLVELVEAGAGRDPGSFEAEPTQRGACERGTLATTPARELADLMDLIRARPSTCNVVAWGRGFGGHVRPAADTALLMNHDPGMRLTGWLEGNTAVQVANLVRPEKHASLPPATVRLHGLLERHTPELGFAGRQAVLGRWARALTHRRVGVALGGGGAWGWAHVALLEGMTVRGVPVDILSGASFGAVAGGLYALGGLPGLTWALQNDGRLQLATNGSMVLGWPMARLLDRLLDDLTEWSTTPQFPLGAEEARLYRANLDAVRDPRTGDPAVRLPQLTLPFYPVATELVTGSEAPLVRGTVGEGVKASGSLPPMFPTSRAQGATFADGGLSRNVPANVLLLEGAAIVVGSNIVPPPFIRSPAHVARSRIRRTLGALNPVRRAVDSVVGAQTLFNQAGAVDTGLAPVLFQTEWNGSMFFQISRGEDIVEDTRGERAFWQAMQGLALRWEGLARPRRGVGPVASTTVAAQGPQEPVSG